MPSSSTAKDDAPTWAHAVAGQMAGMVGLFVVHPIDTVKIRIQANGGAALATASSLVNRDGPLALYRGIGAPMVAYGLINAVAFSTNTAVSRYLGGGSARDSSANAATVPADPAATSPYVSIRGSSVCSEVAARGLPAPSFAAPRSA